MYNQDFTDLDTKSYNDYKRVLSYSLDSQSYDNCIKLSNFLKQYQEACVDVNKEYPNLSQDFKEAQKSLREQINVHITVTAMKPKKTFVVVVPLLAAIIGGLIGSIPTGSTQQKSQILPLTSQQKTDCVQSKE